MAGCMLNDEVWLLVTMKFNVWPASSMPPPGPMPVAHAFACCGGASSSTVWSPPATNTGASLIALTVME